MKQVKIKVVNVTNPKNVLVQIPKFISELWEIKANDSLVVTLAEDASAVIIKKAKAGANDETR